MKFVRWLGAFRQGSDLVEAADWETSQLDRQVAAEPLHRGRSLISHAKIGLVVDHQISVFARAWLTDAWTQTTSAGMLRPKWDPSWRQGKAFRNIDRFLAAWSAVKKPTKWAEAVFDSAIYSAVVVKSSATAHGMARATRLADRLGLPLKVLPD